MFQTAPKQSWFTKSFSDCVKNNDTECLVLINFGREEKHFVHFKVAKGERSQEFQMRYFCECQRAGMTEREMMLEAKETLEKEYSVVGVMERFNDSLLVMEKYLPGDDTINIGRKISKRNIIWVGYILNIPAEIFSSDVSRCGIYFVTFSLNLFQAGFQALWPPCPG